MRPGRELSLLVAFGYLSPRAAALARGRVAVTGCSVVAAVTDLGLWQAGGERTRESWLRLRVAHDAQPG